MADIPAVKVECAFGTDPLTRPAGGAWTRIDTDNPVYEVSVSRGVDMKLGTVETGTARLRIDNTNGYLDPSYASSAYSPNVKPRKRIRISVTPDGGTEAELFTGFVERWPINWRGELGLVDVEATDLLGLLADEPLPQSVLEYEILNDGATHYWPLTEDSGTVVADIAGTADGSYYKAVQPTDSLVPYDGARSQVFGNVPKDGGSPTDIEQEAALGALDFSGSAASAEFWIKLDPIVNYETDFTNFVKIGPVSFSILNLTDSEGNAYYPIYVNFDDQSGSSDANAYTASDVGYAPHEGHEGTHILATYDATNGARVYVNGKLASTQNATGTPTLTGSFGSNHIKASSKPVMVSNRFRLSHLALYETALTAADAQRHYEAGATAWSGDFTGERLGRVLDTIGVDAADRDIETGLEVCGPTILAGENALSYIRRIAATENGALYVAPDGKITFKARENNPATSITFGDDVDSSEVPYVDIDPDYSIDRLVNYAEVTREGGVAQSFEDTTSRSTYGTSPASVSTLHLTPSGARSLAALLVLRSVEPRTTVTRLTVDGRDDAVPQTVTLGLDIADAVTARIFPPYADGLLRDHLGEPILDPDGDFIYDGITGFADFFIERIEQRLTANGEWFTTFGLVEVVTLPTFTWDTADQGWDESIWA